MSAEPAAVRAAEPDASDGAESVTTGSVRSRTKVTTDEEVGPLPAASVTETRTSTGPSGTPGAGVHEPVNGAPFVSASTVVNELEPVGFTSKVTVATPDVWSAAAAASAIVPTPAFAPAAGAVTATPVGAVLSTVLADRTTVVVLPAPSVTISSRS